jgi:hypothetical protein
MIMAMRGALALTVSLLGSREAREHTGKRPNVKEKPVPGKLTLRLS